ncbi:hypothetical protein [Haliovirga abyssi]|uniref:GspL cytoplasmic actin-ATPase-like domain-containing protein n=1 Tax=Haliovirga abyssi TaxID=2996794 RepID=A0AAU9DDU8_9FUSO|nr:hypothetical protein [Haliovirga abyssi]BDU51696.1 hypothetical protein HLVA_22650 [Haliovirga abyssi]
MIENCYVISFRDIHICFFSNNEKKTFEGIEELNRYLSENYKKVNIQWFITPDYVIYKQITILKKLKSRINNMIEMNVLNNLLFPREDVNYKYTISKKDNNLNLKIFIVEKRKFKMKFDKRVNIGGIYPLTEILFTNEKRLIYRLENKYVYKEKDIELYKTEDKRELFESDGDVYNLDSYEKIDKLRKKAGKKLNKLNFLISVKDINKSRIIFKYASIFMVTIIFIMYNTKLIYMNQNYKNSLLKLKSINEKLKKPEGNIMEMKKYLKSKTKEVEKLKELVSVFESKSYIKWLAVIADVSDSTTEIDRITFQKNKLQGISGKSKNASEFLKKLEQSKKFLKLKFRGSIITEKQKERFRIEGELVE